MWDSRARLVAYAAGRYRVLNDVVRHTALVKPGTHAIVVACFAGAVRLRYVNEPLDAVGLKITVGPLRNHWGWVNSDDVHTRR